MGSRIEVYVWRPVQPGSEVYMDHQRYGGNSIIRALLVAARLRLHREPCITIKWRAR